MGLSQLEALIFRKFMEDRRWKFSVRYADFAPHYYTVRDWEDKHLQFLEFVVAVKIIYGRGYKRQWRGKQFDSLDFEGYTYWVMGSPAEETTVVNRIRSQPETDRVHTALAVGNYFKCTPCERVDIGESVAFTWDVMSETLLPEPYLRADVFYVVPPWRSGLKVFDERAGSEPQDYKQFMAHLSNLLFNDPRPKVVISGKHAQAMLPEPQELVPVKYLKEKSFAFIYGLSGFGEYEGKDASEILERLARDFHCGGDFFCGYGQTAKRFLQAGKLFVVSDYNAECIGYIRDNWKGWVKHDS